jgi:hypothetical protein
MEGAALQSAGLVDGEQPFDRALARRVRKFGRSRFAGESLSRAGRRARHHRPTPGTEKSQANAHAPGLVALLCPPDAELSADMSEVTESGFPWNPPRPNLRTLRAMHRCSAYTLRSRRIDRHDGL